MRYREILNDCLRQLGCTAKDLCERSGVSAAALSRYRSGERVPNAETSERLCAALAALAEERKQVGLTAEEIAARLAQAEDLTADGGQLLQNFDTLVSTLHIGINRLCREINYDASAVFRFRNGTRKPADPEKFAAAVAGYVVNKLDSPQSRAALSELLDCPAERLSDSAVRFDRLREWLLAGKCVQENSVSAFLNRVDGFDLNEYIRSIRFDAMKVPTAPFQLPTAQHYFGLREMMESELDFLKATVLSRSTAPVILYSDMPMQEMAKDPEFPKKWMFGMAMLLKKGLHLHLIHNIDRSFGEMMLGLESYIPMYMTGQITPYYLKNRENNVFLHLLKVSGAAALSGEAIAGHHADGSYYLTKSKREVACYRKRAEELLQSASPLMSIYRSEDADAFRAFLTADVQCGGRRRSILSTLPLYTIGETLLESILRRNGFSAAQRQEICACAAVMRENMEAILQTDPVEDEIFDAAAEDLAAHPMRLDLSTTFCEREAFYTPEEYLEHLRSTERFAAQHPNYTLQKTASHAFRNLQIVIHEGKWAMISKGKAPAIHFVIHHPKLEHAIEHFVPPIVEKE